MRCGRVPTFQITITNSEFDTQIEQDFDDFDQAKKHSLKGVLDVASEQLVAGAPFFGAEVAVTDGSSSERFLVALGVSPLMK